MRDSLRSPEEFIEWAIAAATSAGVKFDRTHDGDAWLKENNEGLRVFNFSALLRRALKEQTK